MNLHGWPLPAADQAYGTIDGKHLWQDVNEQADIAEGYRDPSDSEHALARPMTSCRTIWT
jgi:hypothetical protein